jgi:hypothetical protein
MALCYLSGVALPRRACCDDGEPLTRAGIHPLIVFVRQPGDEPLMEGIRSEALRFGWRVEDATLAPSPHPAETPVAVIRYLPGSRGAHLSIHAADRSASPVEEWVVRIDGSPIDVLAIRVVEVLRAHFLLGSAPPTVPARVRTERREPELTGARSQPARLWGSLAIGGAAHGSTGGLEPMGGLVFGAKVGLGGWFVGVTGAWQLGSSTLREPEGSASVRTFGVMAHAGRQVHLAARFDAFAGVGAALWAAAIRGAADSPYVPRSSTPWTVGPSAVLGLEYVLSANLRAGLALHGGTALPPLSIRFVDHEAAYWGAPFGLIALYGAFQF